MLTDLWNMVDSECCDWICLCVAYGSLVESRMKHTAHNIGESMKHASTRIWDTIVCRKHAKPELHRGHYIGTFTMLWSVDSSKCAIWFGFESLEGMPRSLFLYMVFCLKWMFPFFGKEFCSLCLFWTWGWPLLSLLQSSPAVSGVGSIQELLFCHSM